jgi:hypothetical protein
MYNYISNGEGIFFRKQEIYFLLFVWHLGCISNWIWIWGKSYKITSAWIVHLVKKIYLNYCISYHLLNVYMLKSFVVQMAHLFFLSFFYVVLWFVCFICLCLVSCVPNVASVSGFPFLIPFGYFLTLFKITASILLVAELYGC